MEDKQTITSVLNGNRDRYADLVDRHKNMVYAIAWSHLGDRDLSEDAAQETFITAYRSLRSLHDPDKFAGWLATIARNVSKMLLRKKSREASFLSQWSDLESSRASSKELSSPGKYDVDGAFAALSPTYREALTVFYVEGKSVQEAAESLGIKEDAMKVRLHRARTAMRAEMERDLERTLEGLRPTERFTGSVMSVLPGLKIGAIGGFGGAFAKIAAPIAFNPAFALSIAMIGLGTWRESRQIQNIPENQFRRTDIRQRLFARALLFVLIAFLEFHIGGHWFQGLVCLSVLVGGWPQLTRLRVNRSRAAYGSAANALVFAAVSIAVAVFNVSLRHISLPILSIAVISGATQPSGPKRRDYNLFLRSSTGGLLEGGTEIATPKLALTDNQMYGFAQFLGQQWLVRDYSQKGDTMVLMLADVYEFTLGYGSSTVTISRSGECRAKLGRIDRNALERVVGITPNVESLEARVELAVRQTLTCFMESDLSTAGAILTAKSDADIFRPEVLTTKVSVRRPMITALFFAFLLAASLSMVALQAYRATHPHPVTAHKLQSESQ